MACNCTMMVELMNKETSVAQSNEQVTAVPQEAQQLGLEVGHLSEMSQDKDMRRAIYVSPSRLRGQDAAKKYQGTSLGCVEPSEVTKYHGRVPNIQFILSSIKEMHQQLDLARNLRNQHADKVTSLQQMCDLRTEATSAAQAKVVDLEAALADRDVLVLSLQQQLADMTTAKEAAEKQVSNLGSKLTWKTLDLGVAKSQKSALASTIRLLESRLDETTTELEAHQVWYDSRCIITRSMERENQSLHESNQSLLQSKVELESQLARLVTAATGAEAKSSALEMEVKELTRKVQAQAAEAGRKLASLTQQHEAERSEHKAWRNFAEGQKATIIKLESENKNMEAHLVEGARKLANLAEKMQIDEQGWCSSFQALRSREASFQQVISQQQIELATLQEDNKALQDQLQQERNARDVSLNEWVEMLQLYLSYKQETDKKVSKLVDDNQSLHLQLAVLRSSSQQACGNTSSSPAPGSVDDEVQQGDAAVEAPRTPDLSPAPSVPVSNHCSDSEGEDSSIAQKGVDRNVYRPVARMLFSSAQDTQDASQQPQHQVQLAQITSQGQHRGSAATVSCPQCSSAAPSHDDDLKHKYNRLSRRCTALKQEVAIMKAQQQQQAHVKPQGDSTWRDMCYKEVDRHAATKARADALQQEVTQLRAQHAQQEARPSSSTSTSACMIPASAQYIQYGDFQVCTATQQMPYQQPEQHLVESHVDPDFDGIRCMIIPAGLSWADAVEAEENGQYECFSKY